MKLTTTYSTVFLTSLVLEVNLIRSADGMCSKVALCVSPVSPHALYTVRTHNLKTKPRRKIKPGVSSSGQD